MWQIKAIWGSFLESNLTQKKATEVKKIQPLSLFSPELGSNMSKRGHRSLGLRAKVHALRETLMTHNRDIDWLSLKNDLREWILSLSAEKGSPCWRTLPKYLFWLVQFQRRKRNWYWHSRTPSFAPLATSFTISGWVWHSSACLPARRFVFLQMLFGSMTNGLPTALRQTKWNVSSDDSFELHKVSEDKVRSSLQTVRHANHFTWCKAL